MLTRPVDGIAEGVDAVDGGRKGWVRIGDWRSAAVCDAPRLTSFSLRSLFSVLRPTSSAPIPLHVFKFRKEH